MLVGPSIKRYKEIVEIENDMVKNPNWQEADQLAIYKCGRGVELGTTEKQLQLAAKMSPYFNYIHYFNSSKHLVTTEHEVQKCGFLLSVTQPTDNV